MFKSQFYTQGNAYVKKMTVVFYSFDVIWILAFDKGTLRFIEVRYFSCFNFYMLLTWDMHTYNFAGFTCSKTRTLPDHGTEM